MVNNPKRTKKQRLSYLYAFILHDQMVKALCDAEASGQSSIVIENLEPELVAEFEQRSLNADPLTALESIRKTEVAREVMRRNLVMVTCPHILYHSLC